MSIKIEVEENGIVNIEGVRFSVFGLKEALANPPACLFSAKRDGGNLVFTRYDTTEAAASFFAAQKDTK